MKKPQIYEDVIEKIKHLKDISSKYDPITNENDKLKLREFFNELENVIEFV